MAEQIANAALVQGGDRSWVACARGLKKTRRRTHHQLVSPPSPKQIEADIQTYAAQGLLVPDLVEHDLLHGFVRGFGASYEYADPAASAPRPWLTFV